MTFSVMRISDVFFDMDGVLFDSMPNHARAWDEVMAKHGLTFHPEDCYINEGRTSKDVIRLLAAQQGVSVTDEQTDIIYQEKTAAYRQMGGGKPMKDVAQVLQFLHTKGVRIWVVTGGGQVDLYEQLEGFFPGIFRKERMITAFDVTHGKPNPEPYLKAWEKSGACKEQCIVVENAPLGVRAGHAAGLFTIAVNTGPLDDQYLWDEKADAVLQDMAKLLDWFQMNL